MKLLFLFFFATICDGMPASSSSIPVAIPVKRSYDPQQAAYQLPSPTADRLHQVLKTVKAGAQSSRSKGPAEMLWVPVPAKGEKNPSLLPIPITEEMSSSKSPFKIVIVDGEKGSSTPSIEGIEKLLAQLEPLTQNVDDIPVHEHQIRIQPLRGEEKLPFQVKQPNSFRQLEKPDAVKVEENYKSPLPPAPFRETASKANKYMGKGIEINRLPATGGQNYREQFEEKYKGQSESYSKQEQRQSENSYGGQSDNSYGGQSDNSYGEQIENQNVYTAKAPSNVGNYENQNTEQGGRSYGTGGKTAKQQHGAGSYVHVEVNSYGSHPSQVASKDYRKEEEATSQVYGGQNYDVQQQQQSKMKPFGKAQVHVTITGEEEGGYDAKQQVVFEPVSEAYGGASPQDGPYMSTPVFNDYESEPIETSSFRAPILESYSTQQHTQTVYESSGDSYNRGQAEFQPPEVVSPNKPQLPAPSRLVSAPQQFAPSGDSYGQPPSDDYGPPPPPPPSNNYGPPPPPSSNNYGPPPPPPSNNYGPPPPPPSSNNYGPPPDNYAPSTSGYGISVSSASYGSSTPPPFTGYEQSPAPISESYTPQFIPSGYRPSPKPPRPSYPEDEEMEEEIMSPPPCKHANRGYEPRPSISIPEPVFEPPHISMAFNKYQSGVQVAPPPVYSEPPPTQQIYRSNEGSSDVDVASSNVHEQFQSRGKPFYIVIFQKQKKYE